MALAVAQGSACSGKSASATCDGKERCACYANLTCNVGLVCLSDICVAPAGVGGAGVGGMTTGLGGAIGAVGTGGALATGGSSGGAMGVGGMTVATGGAAGSAACVGPQGCACYPNLTCNSTLTCAGGVCVSSGVGGATAGPGGATPGAGGAIGAGGTAGPSLIKNGDFSLGKTYWDLTPNDGEIYSQSYTGGEYCVRNESSSLYLSFSLGYPPTPTDAFPIEVGATYTLSYRLKVTGAATVMVKIGQASPPYTELVPSVPFTDSITTGLGVYQTFSHQLQFTLGDPTAGLVFNTALLDYYPITICFDDIRLVKD